jgi:hypothetical protein
MRLTYRQRLAIFCLRYGYANWVPGSWINAILLLGPDKDWPPRGTVWQSIGPRAQRRLIANGLDRTLDRADEPKNAASDKDPQAPKSSVPA